MTARTKPPLADGTCGLIQPHELFDRPLPYPFILDAGLPFEERVARAWEHIKATRFMPEEHERLREVLVKLIANENRTGESSQEPSS
jgi:hypothetical protein